MTPIMQVIEKSKNKQTTTKKPKTDLKIIHFVSFHMTNKVKTSHVSIYHSYIEVSRKHTKLLTTKKMNSLQTDKGVDEALLQRNTNIQ